MKVRFVLPVLILLVAAPSAFSVCAPFPCDECMIRSQGQLNLVVMDRENGRIRMIPNMRFTGNASSFAVVVPTSALPELSPAESRIWNDAQALTSALRQPAAMDCDNESVTRPATGDTDAATDDGAGGVVIHGEHTIGSFLATIVSSDSSTALVDWLNENGFSISETDASLFAPYVERGWFFTAMKLDTSKVETEVPSGGWNTDLNPVIFDYEGDEFELALPIISINRAPSMPVLFFVVDDHRSALDGFRTRYANRINAEEGEAIAWQYPAIAEFVTAGTYLTRLDRTFTSASVMSKSILLKRASTDDEYRWSSTAWSGLVSPDLALLAVPILLFRMRHRRRR